MRVCVDCERRGWLMVTRIGPAANAATAPRSSAQQQGGGEPVDPSELRAFAEKLKSRTAAGALPAPRADIDG